MWMLKVLMASSLSLSCRCENNDYLEIFHSGPTAGDRYSIKHCGRQFPGPILADRQIEIKFISRRNSKNSTGFEARFEFVHPDSLHTSKLMTQTHLLMCHSASRILITLTFATVDRLI